LRKVAATILAVPVLALLYLPVVLRRSVMARVVLGIGVGSVVAVAALGVVRPVETTATPPTRDVPLARAAFRTNLRVGQEPNAAIDIAFSTPMDPLSVAAALRVVPATAVDLAWNTDRTVLTVTPDPTWRLATYHTITIEAGALAASGRPMSSPARAAFLTRPATTAALSATGVSKGRAGVDATFVVEFDHPIDPATIGGGILVEPAVSGTVGPADDSDRRFVFSPTVPLAADMAYRVTLAPSIRDATGAHVLDTASLVVRTVAAPSVVRFRPRDKTEDVSRETAVSVRFTEPMDRAATAAAVTVSVGAAPVTGTVTFAERDTVLVFTPKRAFGYGQTITMAVDAEARSKTGVAIAHAWTGTFTTEAAPATSPKPATPAKAPAPSKAPAPAPAPKPPSAGSGSWTAVESYYLRLMNCTRTGGWVTSTGSCSSPGGRDVAPLRLDSGISAKVARPYAKFLATRALCDHFADGGPDDRLRRAGYTSYLWAENLGCRSGDPYKAVLGSHLYFQGEKSYNGGHYVNLMNARYDRVGIGVWVSGGRVRLVVDFYHPR